MRDAWRRLLLVLSLALGTFGHTPATAAADASTPWTPGPNALEDDTYAGFIDSPSPGSTVAHNSTVLVQGWVVDRTAVGWTGIDWFLEALPRLGCLLNKVMVLIIGQGSLEPRLRQIAAKLGPGGRVHFAGFVPHAEVPGYLASFDIAVAPYRKVELFYNSPMKLYEYLAMGKPVIASRMGQSAELIKDGENGLLYEPDDADGMLNLLSLLIEDAALRARLGRAAHVRSGEMAWTWERNAAAILALCRAAAARMMETTISSKDPL